MSRLTGYSTLGLAIVAVTGVFVVFSDENMVDYDFTGIACDVRDGKNGCTFDLQTSEDGIFRCFYGGYVSDLGYYAVSGEFSDDGSIFFISSIHSLD